MAFTDLDLLTIFITFHSSRPRTVQRTCKNMNYAVQTLARSLMLQHDPKLLLKNHTFGLFFSPPGQEIAGYHCLYRGYALQRLRLFKEALLNYKEVMMYPLSESEEENAYKRLTVLRNILKGEKDVKKTEVQLSYGENSYISGVSSAITFAYNEVDGRHFIAKRHIKIGDVLMIQKPYAYVPLDNSCDERKFLKDDENYLCHNCLNYSVAPFPCENCFIGTFCSPECKHVSLFQHHRIECRLLHDEILPYRMGLRLFLIATNQNSYKVKEAMDLAEAQQNCSDKLHAGERNGEFDGNSLEAVLSLPNYFEVNRIGIASYAAQMSLELLNNTNIIPADVALLDVAKFISQMIFIFTLNWTQITRNSETNMVACGLYPTISLMRHSCVANTIAYNDNENVKYVRAAREIKKGEKITRSIITQEDLLKFSAIQRKNCINTYNNFSCNCEACENNYDFKFELEGQLEVPKGLKEKLLMNPKDEKSLWKLLELITKKYKSPCLEVKLVEMGILDAVMGKVNPELEKAFPVLGIS